MKKNSLVKHILLFLGITFSAILNAQEIQGKTYAIIGNSAISSMQPYIDALNNSDMKYHRLKKVRNIIEFNTGVKVELFSATEINANVHPLNLSDYSEKFPTNRDIPVFSLGPNNFIMEEHHLTGKSH